MSTKAAPEEVPVVVEVVKEVDQPEEAINQAVPLIKEEEVKTLTEVVELRTLRKVEVQHKSLLLRRSRSS